MPEHPKFLHRRHWLSPEEIFDITSKLVDRGVDELRLTGGEPLLRPEFIEIASQLSQLKVKKYGMTTNGELLDNFLQDIKQHTKIQSINISIDSLDPDNFSQITKGGRLSRVLNGLHQALSLGFPIKVNAVLMRGVNDHEWDDFIHFSENTGVEVRFLEFMKIGPMQDKYTEYFMTAAEMIDKVKVQYELTPMVVPKDNTSFNFKTNSGAQLGFIASESQSFCSQCSRLRLTCTGELRPCLFKNTGVSLRGLSGTELDNALTQIAGAKPLERIESISQAMHAIGG
jgi:cyclic pyranopterin phosphate synthase